MKKTFMVKIRWTEINIETHEQTVIRLRSGEFTVYCQRCRKTTTVFAPEQIAELFQINLTEVCILIEADELYLVGTRRSTAFICGGSLGDKYKILFGSEKERKNEKQTNINNRSNSYRVSDIGNIRYLPKH